MKGYRSRQPSRIEERRKEAKERQALRDKRTDEDQIAVLDARLGDGKGAKKERTRLNDPRFCILEEDDAS